MGKDAEESREGPQVRGDAKGVQQVGPERSSNNGRGRTAEVSRPTVASVIRLTNTLALLNFVISRDFRHTSVHLMSRTRIL